VHLLPFTEGIPEMVIVADDALFLPIQFIKLILNALIQTTYKTAWAEYRRDLNILLLQLKRDYREQKISKEEMKEMEAKIFLELRIAKKMLGPST
jgi:chaperonin cofactor prefoldin